jgi:hypothetical protein
MRIPIACLALALAAQTAHAKLEVRGVQASYGQLGPERKSADYVPGEEVYLRFTLDGVKSDDQGRAGGELRMTVRDTADKVLFDRKAPIQQVLAFGGGRVPAFASVELGHQFPPGKYELTVEYADLLAKDQVSFKHPFTVKPVDLAIARLRFSQDEAGRVPARVGGVLSQTLFFKFQAVGFDRSKGAIDVDMDVRVLDAKGQPVAPRGVRAAAHSEDPEAVKNATHVNFSGELTLHRPGDFVLRITVTDKATKKTVTFEAPMKVLEP